MTLRIPLSNGNYLTLFSVYAPTLNSEDYIKDSFYTILSNAIKSVPKRDKLLVLGDFNARVGRDYKLWEGILGKQGIGSCNSNGFSLLNLCAENELAITNTLFRLPNRHKTTWKHPRSKHWTILDYVLTRSCDRRDVLITRSMPGADDCWTDHRLLISRLRFRLRNLSGHKMTKRLRCFNIERLKIPSVQNEYSNRISQILNEVGTSFQQATVEQDWNIIRTSITKAAEDVIGFSTRQHQDWFDQNDVEILQLIDKKKSARLSLENRYTRASSIRFQEAKQECQRKIREIQNLWWQKKAREIQSYADGRDLRRFYAATKEIFGPRRVNSNALKTADEKTTLTEGQDILKRWKEHFEELLNRTSTAADDLLNNVPQLPIRHWMSIPPTFSEFLKAMNRMKAWKAPGSDNIPLELISQGGTPIVTRLFKLILQIWETKYIPDDLKNATILPIFKKGDRSLCDNYRGIVLLSAAGKIFARILLDRLLRVAEEVLPETQSGFRPSRGTTDMIFCARLLQEKSREQRRPLYFVFWDLKKAFDSVPRPAMWATLKRFGCTDHFTDLVQALHDGMTGRVVSNSSVSDSFPITTGLKQGCVLAPTLFSLYLAAMVNELSDTTPGIQLRCRMDGGLFNTGRFRTSRYSTSVTIRELQYADDNATPVDTVDALQETVNLFDNAYTRFGLTTNIDKTKILIQNAPQDPTPNTSCVHLRGHVLETVDAFCYLGSYLSNDCSTHRDIDNRIRSAHIAFGRLSKRVFMNKDLNFHTKIMVFRAVVLSTLLYGSEVWTLYKSDIKRLEHFQQQKLRSILKIKWQDHITNESVLSRANLPSIESVIARHCLRWAGHVRRMSSDRLPRQVLFSQLEHGTRPRGAPKRRFCDQLKANLLRCQIDKTNWETIAKNRSDWRQIIIAGTDRMENQRRFVSENKRQKRKQKLLLPLSQPTLSCPNCSRLFRSNLGLSSHLRNRHPNLKA